jgi:hypothetical protein
MDNYFKVPCTQFDDVFNSNVSKYAKVVWLYSKYIEYHKSPWPNNQQIAKACRISIPHVEVAIKTLTSKGFLKVGANNG